MSKNFSTTFINLSNGQTTQKPLHDGIYLKTLMGIKDDDTIAFFPTTFCLSKFSNYTISSEMKLNLYKKTHPDYSNEQKNLRILLDTICQKRFVCSVDLTYATANVAILDNKKLYLNAEQSIDRISYSLFDVNSQLKADAIITNDSQVALIMYSADCPTAFLYDRKTKAIGVLHSTWRSFAIRQSDNTVTSIVEETVRKMTECYGTNPKDLEVTIFPCIDLNQFCVDQDVVEKFQDQNLNETIYKDSGNEKFHIDLTEAMKKLFLRYGVNKESIITSPYRTCDYGFNSLRMAPRNTRRDLNFCTEECDNSISELSHLAPTLLSDAENKANEVRSSALNFLIVVK